MYRRTAFSASAIVALPRVARPCRRASTAHVVSRRSLFAQWCNSSLGILPELKRLLGGYQHVASVGVDEIFVRTEACPSAAAPVHRHWTSKAHQWFKSG